jgi:hypothetical protein
MRTTTSLNLARLALVLVPIGLLCACAGKPRSHVYYFAPQTENPVMTNGRLASLGAGDALGVQVRRNDIYLAYLRERGQPMLLTGVSNDQ